MADRIFTDAQKAAAAAREVAMRRSVYPRQISAGKMKQAEADEGIAIMAAIERDYREKVNASQGKLALENANVIGGTITETVKPSWAIDSPTGEAARKIRGHDL